MKHDIYLLSSMTQPGYWDDLTRSERESVTSYLEDMQQGPADGGMDGQWQETSRGYYTHLEILGILKVENPQAVGDYMTALKSDTTAWLAIKPGKHEVLNLEKMLNS